MKLPASLALDPTAPRNRSSSHDTIHSFLAAAGVVVGVAGARVVVGAATNLSDSTGPNYRLKHLTHLPFGLL